MKDLPKVPRVGFEPAIVRTPGTELTTEPPQLHVTGEDSHCLTTLFGNEDDECRPPHVSRLGTGTIKTRTVKLQLIGQTACS